MSILTRPTPLTTVRMSRLIPATPTTASSAASTGGPTITTSALTRWLNGKSGGRRTLLTTAAVCTCAAILAAILFIRRRQQLQQPHSSSTNHTAADTKVSTTASLNVPTPTSAFEPTTTTTPASTSSSSSTVSRDPAILKEKWLAGATPLHWVFKVSDLRASVDFYSSIFGFRVQRHEEFDTGCEATCNGPYSGWWSKTMMSLTSEKDFSLELTYNYGVSAYQLGNDLDGIHVAILGAIERARAQGVEVHETDDPNVSKIRNPDGQWFYLHEPTSSKEEVKQKEIDPVLFVSLNTANLARATDYYVNVLGMTLYSSTATTSLVGYESHRTKLQLLQLPTGVAVDHGQAFGRVAFATTDVLGIYARVLASSDHVIHTPVTLSTPNKASVLVAILSDRDGNEICMVDQNDFDRLSQTKPGDELINWESRNKRIVAQNKFAKAFAKGANKNTN